MQARYARRTEKSWEVQEWRSASPKEIKAAREAVQKKLSECQASRGKNLFDIAMPNEEFLMDFTGNLTEMSEAGVCLGCLGAKKKDGNDCPDCGGTGNACAKKEHEQCNQFTQ